MVSKSRKNNTCAWYFRMQNGGTAWGHRWTVENKQANGKQRKVWFFSCKKNIYIFTEETTGNTACSAENNRRNGGPYYSVSLQQSAEKLFQMDIKVVIWKMRAAALQ